MFNDFIMFSVGKQLLSFYNNHGRQVQTVTDTALLRTSRPKNICVKHCNIQTMIGKEFEEQYDRKFSNK